MRKILLLLTATAFVLNSSINHAYAQNPDEAELTVSPANGNYTDSLQVDLVLDTHEHEIYGYDIVIDYSGKIEYESYTTSSDNCQPDVATLDDGNLSLVCLVPPVSEPVKGESELVTLNFAVKGDGVAKVSIVDVDLGGIEVDTEDGRYNIQSLGTAFESAEEAAVESDQVPLLQLAIVLFVILSIVTIYVVNKKNIQSHAQLRMFTFALLMGTAIVSSVYLLTSETDFDTRERAGQCQPKCSGKECGSDGCGDVCGQCEGGQLCGEAGLCVFDKPAVPGIPDEFFACEKDSDCLQVTTNCCGCETGGEDISINKKYEEKYDEIKQCTGDEVCPQVLWCNNYKPVCKENICTLVQLEGGPNPPENPAGDVKDEVPDGPKLDIVNDVDLNGDGRVSVNDYRVFIGDFLKWKETNRSEERSDLNQDGRVSIADYSFFLEGYLNSRR